MATDILTVQCQSYLVAINTLVLVQSEKQWILVGKEGLKQAPVVSKLRFRRYTGITADSFLV